MCLSPLTLRVDNEQGKRSVQVPCGKCEECLRLFQNDWMVRLYEQFVESKKCIFFTLTYNEDTVPKVADSETGEMYLAVCAKHIQDAFKRFRIGLQNRGIKKKIKYFICSEYGPRTLRPHYHGMLFGLTYVEALPFFKDWQKRFGFTNQTSIKFSDKDAFNVSRYVSKYCSKGMFESPLVKDGKVPSTFRLISKGIGLSYVVRMRSYHRGFTVFPHGSRIDPKTRKYKPNVVKWCAENRKVRIPSVSYGFHMPKYYRDKIFVPKSALSVAMSNFLFDESLRLREKQLEQLQAQWNCSYHEANYVQSCLIRGEYEQRRKETFKALADFYDHSQL